MAAAVAEAADVLKDAGYTVEPVRIPVLEQNNYMDPTLVLYGAELSRYIRPIVGDRVADSHFPGKAYATLPAPATADYIEAEMKVERLKAAFAAYFDKYDVFLCPVLGDLRRFTLRA